MANGKIIHISIFDIFNNKFKTTIHIFLHHLPPTRNYSIFNKLLPLSIYSVQLKLPPKHFTRFFQKTLIYEDYFDTLKELREEIERVFDWFTVKMTFKGTPALTKGSSSKIVKISIIDDSNIFVGTQYKLPKSVINRFRI